MTLEPSKAWTDVYLCRHAERKFKSTHHGGRSKYGLTELGKLQANRLGSKLKGLGPFDFFWSSTLPRAVETSTIISHIIDKPFEAFDSLREINNGVLANKSHEETDSLLKDLPPKDEWDAHTKIPGGETVSEFYQRAAQFYEEQKNLIEGKKTLIITHSGLLNGLLRHLLNFPVSIRGGLTFDFSEASLTRLSVRGDELHLQSLNDISHLI